jgi:signal transduction histidine kinase
MAHANWRGNDKPLKPPTLVFRVFGGLNVRRKLAFLHNVFFMVLAASVYLSVIPLFSRQIEATKQRELLMISQMMAAEIPVSARQQTRDVAIDETAGTAQAIDLPSDGQQYLQLHPNATWIQGESVFRVENGGLYRRVTLTGDFYNRALHRAKLMLFATLGAIYILSIVVLEFIIMPQYVYQPLTLMLKADEATQRDDRRNEMIDDQFILNDEIGQIMRSRNETVAQLRHQEDHLASALQKLEEQDRLVSLGLLSTSVAHELNTPLAVLQGSIEKLLESNLDPHTLERVNRMLRVTQRLRKISEGLVDFARVRKQENEAVDVRSLIDESWSLVAIDEKASAVTFQNHVRAGDKVVGNPDRLVQVFVNLLRNALIAVSSGGVIKAESRLLQRGGQTWICCSVVDNGPGIPAHVLPNLFEAFVSTRLDARGTGLGLTVAEGIVTQHGGTISASNRPEGGAALEVVLPAATALASNP